MSDELLRVQYEELERKLYEAEQLVTALTNREIDSVAHAVAATPLLLSSAQAQLRAREQQLRAVFDAAGDAMLVVDRARSIVDANRCATVLFGLDREALVGRRLDELIPMDGAEDADSRLMDGREGKLLLLRPDGELRDTDYRATVDILPGLDLLVLRDMTERRQAESRFRLMLEKSHDGIALFDAAGRVLYASPGAQRIVGVANEHLTGLTSATFVHVSDRTRMDAFLREVVQTPSVPLTADFRVLHSDGTTRWVSATVCNFLHEREVAAIVGNFHDVTDAKNAALLLEETQRLLEEAQGMAHVGSWALRAGAQTIAWSAECARIFGRAGQPPPTMDAFTAMVHPDDLEQVLDARAMAMARGETLASEHRIITATGEVRWVHARTIRDTASPTPSTESGGAEPVYRAIGVVQDITDRKRAEDARRVSDLRYRRIVDNTSEGVWTYDASGLTTFMSHRMAEMLGLSEQEAIGTPVVDFVEETLREHVVERVMPRTARPTERSELSLRRRDGAELWVSIVADPLLDAFDNFDGGLALVADISERRRADAMKNRLAAIVASSDDAIFSLDVDGIILTWNRGAERLTQYTAAQVIGRSVEFLNPPGSRSKLATAWQQLSARERQLHRETLLRADGSAMEMSISVSPLVDDSGAPQGASVVARDISERLQSEAALRRSEEQLRQAQKMEAIGSLAGGVAHDFNNILSVILSYGEIIARDLQPGDPVLDDIEQMNIAARRGAELTRQLLMFSRQRRVEPKVIDLSVLLAGLDKMLKRLVGSDVLVVMLPAEGPARVRVDPGSVEQVVMNLVVNARDAMPKGGTVTIEVSNVELDSAYAQAHLGVNAGRYVMMAVTDTGEGMDEETARRIYEPFFTTKAIGKGTGLGLAMVFGIVQQSYGHITVQSEVGRGTTFKIYLPRVSAGVDSLNPDPAPRSIRGTESILLVEDDESVRTVASNILRRAGYRVVVAQNAGEALILCENPAQRFDMLLTDVVMPTMRGPDLAKRLIESRPDLKVLCMSGYTDADNSGAGLVEDRMAFLQKPITPNALAQKVREVLDRPEGAERVVE